MRFAAIIQEQYLTGILKHISNQDNSVLYQNSGNVDILSEFDKLSRITIDVLILDIKCVEEVNQLQKAIRRYRLTHEKTRIILIAEGYEAGDVLLSSMVNMDICDIVTDDNVIENVKQLLDNPATYEDVKKYDISSSTIDAVSAKKTIIARDEKKRNSKHLENLPFFAMIHKIKKVDTAEHDATEPSEKSVNDVVENPDESKQPITELEKETSGDFVIEQSADVIEEAEKTDEAIVEDEEPDNVIVEAEKLDDVVEEPEKLDEAIVEDEEPDDVAEETEEYDEAVEEEKEPDGNDIIGEAQKLVEVIKEVPVYNNIVIGTPTIAVSGISRGIGCTHLSMALALYLTSLGYSVALNEFNDSDDMLCLCGYNNIKPKKSCFNYKKVDVYSKEKMSTLVNYGYDYVILDVGSLAAKDGNSSALPEVERATLKIILSGVSDWNIIKLSDFINNISNEKIKWNIVLNNVPPNKSNEISRVMDDIPYIELPVFDYLKMNENTEDKLCCIVSDVLIKTNTQTKPRPKLKNFWNCLQKNGKENNRQSPHG